MAHPIENIMQTSMEHIKQLVDVNTVIGSPLMTDDNTMILPVSKVSLGMLVGGGEYLAVAAPKKSQIDVNCEGNYPFIGTSTLGMSLTPLAFLAVQEGSVRVLPAKQDCASERIIDLIPQLMETAERIMKEYTENGKNCRGTRPIEMQCGTRLKEHRGAGEEEKDDKAGRIRIEYGEDDDIQ